VTVTAGVDDATGYGGFAIGALRLALPIAAMREVMPRTGIVAVPCTTPAVIGAVDLRGTLVPVVDLGRLLGRDDAPSSARAGAVLLVVHAGRLLIKFHIRPGTDEPCLHYRFKPEGCRTIRNFEAWCVGWIAHKAVGKRHGDSIGRAA